MKNSRTRPDKISPQKSQPSPDREVKENNPVYRVKKVVGNMGWVDLDLGVLPSCPAAQPLLSYIFPSAQAELGTVEH